MPFFARSNVLASCRGDRDGGGGGRRGMGPVLGVLEDGEEEGGNSGLELLVLCGKVGWVLVWVWVGPRCVGRVRVIHSSSFCLESSSDRKNSLGDFRFQQLTPNKAEEQTGEAGKLGIAGRELTT